LSALTDEAPTWRHSKGRRTCPLGVKPPIGHERCTCSFS
jgi:hypothetical protein